MSQSVARLKELLFDDETQALADLKHRIDVTAAADAHAREDLARRLAVIADADAKGRTELGYELRAKIDDIIARAVTSDKLTDSVAAILSAALRKAEVAQHAELSTSIAPLVVTTIKAELRNSRDEMVEALYPLTGRMVKAYVASAMKDLAAQMNRRIELNPVMLRLRSLTTGRSVAELAMVDTQDFEISDILLIRRGSGELLARWPDAATSGRDHVMSGVLAAINEFANEALSADQGQLRQIDLGGSDVYLRGSPKFLLAARCSGTAPPSIERLIDDAFLSAIERQHVIDGRAAVDAGSAQQSALASVGGDLARSLSEEKLRLRRPAGGGALKFVAFLILAPLIGWLASIWYDGFARSQTRAAASNTIAAQPAMQGYPVKFDVSAFGRSVTVSGLVPSEDARFSVAHNLRRNLPRVAVVDKLALVAGAGVKQAPDLTEEFALLRGEQRQQAVAAALGGADRTLARLAAAAIDLKRAGAAAQSAEQTASLDKLSSEIAAERDTLELARAALSVATSNREISEARDSLAIVAARLSELAPEIERAALPAAVATRGSATAADDLSTLAGVIDALLARSERTAALAASAPLAIALAPKPPPGPTPRQKLEDAVRAKAVFFNNGVDYRDANAARAAIAVLAPLIKDANALVRVVGYTDETGGATINSPLAQQRADRVRDALVAAGAPAKLLASVGRNDRYDLSGSTGAGSPNRRVEFEIGFDGEVAP